MLLQNKNAVIYGAGGSLGGAVSKALAAAGARVFLTGWRKESIEKVKDGILAAGGQAETAIVDGYDQEAIEDHLASVVKTADSVDISFNAVDIPLKQGVPLIDLSMEEVVGPVTKTLQTRFLTATAAVRLMKNQRSGVILSLTATPGGIAYPMTAGFAPACCAVECFSRNLASEVGIYGIRVVNIRSGGSPDSRVFQSAIDSDPGAMAEVLRMMEGDTMLKKMPLMADIANVAVFLASDQARMITGVTVDVTSGTTAGLNYRVESPVAFRP